MKSAALVLLAAFIVVSVAFAFPSLPDTQAAFLGVALGILTTLILRPDEGES